MLKNIKKITKYKCIISIDYNFQFYLKNNYFIIPITHKKQIIYIGGRYLFNLGFL